MASGEELLAAAYADGVADERARWRKATGARTAVEYERAVGRARLFPVAHVEIGGQMRAVRGYPNGRYGYWNGVGDFVDLEPPAGYWSSTPRG